MPDTSEKERKVLEQLLKDSNRQNKLMANNSGLSESEFSKTVKHLLVGSKIIKNYTVDLDYEKLGYSQSALFLFAVENKRGIDKVVEGLKHYKEIIEIQEVFGSEYDMFIRIMAKTNHRIREICDEVVKLENIKGDNHAFTLIFAKTYRHERGIIP